MGAFYLVTGAPCSGKSTFVEKHRGPHDLVLDMDALQRALGSHRSHFHDRARLKFALACREAIVREWRRVSFPSLWYISWWPRPAEEAWFPKSAIRYKMPTTQEECHRRAREAGRPPQTAGLIDRWFREHGHTLTSTPKGSQ